MNRTVFDAAFDRCNGPSWKTLLNLHSSNAADRLWIDSLQRPGCVDSKCLFSMPKRRQARFSVLCPPLLRLLQTVVRLLLKASHQDRKRNALILMRCRVPESSLLWFSASESRFVLMYATADSMLHQYDSLANLHILPQHMRAAAATAARREWLQSSRSASFIYRLAHHLNWFSFSRTHSISLSTNPNLFFFCNKGFT